jgi:2-haloacid dehalogenase
MPAMQRVRTDELPWTRLDDLQRMVLDQVLAEFGPGGAACAPEPEIARLAHAWRRLRPWPDAVAVAGLARLKRRYIIAPLSNGNIALITQMAKVAGLPWDCVLGAELALRHKSPTPRSISQRPISSTCAPPRS